MSLATAPQPAARWADISKADLVIDDTIGGYWNANASTVRQMLAERKGQPINVHMDSPGGYAYDGLAIYEMLRNHAAEAPVSVYIYGKAMSAASIIAMAASPGKLFAAPSAQLMVHKAKVGAFGNADDLKSMADSLSNIDETMLEIYMRRTGQAEDKLREVMTEAGTFMTATQALGLKFIDAIVEPPTALATLFQSPAAAQQAPPTALAVVQPTATAGGTKPTTPKPKSKMEKELLALLNLAPEATLAQAEKKITALLRKGRTEVVSRLEKAGVFGEMPKAMKVAFDDLVARKPLAALDMLLAQADAAPAAEAEEAADGRRKPKAEAGVAKPFATLKKHEGADFAGLINALQKGVASETQGPKAYKDMNGDEIRAMEKSDPDALAKLIREGAAR